MVTREEATASLPNMAVTIITGRQPHLASGVALKTEDGTAREHMIGPPHTGTPLLGAQASENARSAPNTISSEPRRALNTTVNR